MSFVAIGFFVVATFALGANYDRGQVIPEVKLKNGTVLHDLKVVGVGSTTVVARWAGGQGSIALTQLPQEMLAALAPAAAPKPAVTSAPIQPAAAGAASVELPSDIRLTSGFVMHRSVVTHWDEQAVLVSYQGGIVPVQLKNIVPEQRAIFEARKSEALAEQARKSAEQALADQAARRKELERQTKVAENASRPISLIPVESHPEEVFPGEIRLKDGRRLNEFVIRKVGANYIEAGWRGGGGRIEYELLPYEVLSQLTMTASTLPIAIESQESSQLEAPRPARRPPPTEVRLPSDIKLTNGFVMRHSTVTRWEEHAVLVSYQGGVVLIQFKNMVPEQRAIFEAGKAEALAAQAQMGATQDSVDQAASKLELVKQAKAAQWKEEDESNAEEISKGLRDHYLVKGMTKDQVKQAFGSPHDGTTIYRGRGLDKRGVVADRYLHYDDLGILTDWVDQNGNDWTNRVYH